MEDYFNIHSCESCNNLILLRDKKDEIFPCPLCGTLNSVEENLMAGTLTLVSPPVICENDPKDKKSVLLRDLDDDMDKSIRVLLDRGWKLKFTGD